MPQPALIMLVRFRTKLSLDEVMKVANSRISQYRALTGLQQKYYLEDAETGEVAGLYLWESPEALAEFRESDLRATIASEYQIEGEPRVEVYRVEVQLRE
jgi:heme-degrading monooxygenase HmoA